MQPSRNDPARLGSRTHIPDAVFEQLCDDLAEQVKKLATVELTNHSARLLADIWSRDGFANQAAEEALLLYIRLTIQSSKQDGTALRLISELCLYQSRLLLGILNYFCSVFHKFAKYGMSQVDEIGPFAASIEDAKFFSFTMEIIEVFECAVSLHPDEGQSSIASLQMVEDVHSFLAFLKVFLSSRSQIQAEDAITEQLIAYLLIFAGASKKDIAKIAQDTLHTWLSVAQASHSAFYLSSAAFQRTLLRIQKCYSLLLERSSEHKTFSLTLWMRWLSLMEHDEPSLQTLEIESYWQSIQRALRLGTTEQQKYCLHILSTSITLLRFGSCKSVFGLRSELRELYPAAFHKYCFLFNTVAHGRYANQVEECLPELTSLFSSGSIVDKSWGFSLLAIAMRKEVQESVRIVIGHHVMGLSWNISEEFRDFLTSGFLPWALQGQLFLSPLERNGYGWTSCHGLSLQRFFQKLMLRSSKSDKVQIIRTALGWMINEGYQASFYGSCHILAGLVEGLDSGESLDFSPDDLSLIVKISLRANLTDLIKDMYILYSELLCRASSSISSTDLAAVPGYTSLREAARLIYSTENRVTQDSLDWMPTTIEEYSKALDKNPKWFESRNLVRSFKMVLQAVDQLKQPFETNSHLLFRVLSALYDELERQEYPKNAIREWPALILHPNCLISALNIDELREFAVKSIKELQKYTESRVYLFTPFWSALRTAILRTHQVALSIIPLDVFIIRVSSHPPLPRFELVLDSGFTWDLEQLCRKCNPLPTEAPSRNFAYYFGRNQGYGYACFIDLVNRLHIIDPDLHQRLLDAMMEPWIRQKNPVPSVTKWKTTLQLQIILILTEHCRPSWSVDQAVQYADLLFEVLFIEPLPRLRYILEWVLTRLLVLGSSSTGRETLLQSLEDYSTSREPKDLCSLLRIAAMVCRNPVSDLTYGLRFMVVLTRLATSNKVSIRHEAQWLFPKIWDQAEENGWAEVLSNPAFQNINDFIRSLPQFRGEGGFNKPLGEPFKNHSLVALFEGEWLGTEPPGEMIVTGFDFKHLWSDDQLSEINHFKEEAVPLGELKPERPFQPWSTTYGVLEKIGQKAFVTNDNAGRIGAPILTHKTPFQTKGTAWQTQLLSFGDLSRHKSKLIIVASLIDNAHNLGGLSRIAEVFGAQTLYVANPTVVGSKEFLATSVSSHLHMAIEPLLVDNIVTFLLEKKGEGYTVVGVEQTDKSSILGGSSTQLPQNCVLVMGAEKTGIPGDILVECDMCVEIKQAGVTRSLNVQTAAGIVGFEYQRQWSREK